MANQTATDYGVYPPRATQIGPNIMHANMVTTISASASDNMYMFPIPPECFIVAGAIKASVPTGTTGNIILEVGIPNNNVLVGTFTLSGTAVLATTFNIYSPITVSSSGTDAPTPVVISVLSAASTTTSVSIYLRLNYIMPGNIN